MAPRPVARERRHRRPPTRALLHVVGLGRVTMRYAHLAPERLRSAVTRLRGSPAANPPPNQRKRQRMTPAPPIDAVSAPPSPQQILRQSHVHADRREPLGNDDVLVRLAGARLEALVALALPPLVHIGAEHGGGN